MMMSEQNGSTTRDGERRAGGLNDEELSAKDTSESPGSEAETAAKQDDPMPVSIDDDIDRSPIRAVPGTGGPDDFGDIEVDEDDLNVSGRG